MPGLRDPAPGSPAAPRRSLRELVRGRARRLPAPLSRRAGRDRHADDERVRARALRLRQPGPWAFRAHQAVGAIRRRNRARPIHPPQGLADSGGIAILARFQMKTFAKAGIAAALALAAGGALAQGFAASEGYVFTPRI